MTRSRSRTRSRLRLSEGDFQGWVCATATQFGWRWWHVPAPMRVVRGGFVGAREAAGLCDLVMVHEDPPRLLLVEVKGDGGKLSDEQREFLRLASTVAAATADLALEAGGARTLGVYVWSPADRDIIEGILRGKVLA